MRSRALMSRRHLVRCGVGTALSLAGAGALAGCATGTEPVRDDPRVELTGPYQVSAGRQVSYGELDEQFGVYWLPLDAQERALTGTRPLVIMVHGGSWMDTSSMRYMVDVARDLVSHGVVVWSLNYRGTIPEKDEHGRTPRPGWPLAGQDVAAGVDFARDLAERLPVRTDVSRAMIFGHSAGGHLATWAASRHKLPDDAVGARPRVRPVACVSMAGVLDLGLDARETVKPSVKLLMDGTALEKPDDYRVASPRELVPIGVPVVACHGRLDTVVAPSQAESYVAAAREAGDEARVEMADQADHSSWIHQQDPTWERARGHILSFARP